MLNWINKKSDIRSENTDLVKRYIEYYEKDISWIIYIRHSVKKR